ncbi:MAG: hypothetical protein OXC70_07870 [Gammaproteobacteria bacterium]|nr:hypothetical protein [Gammaproteobacteria bacterium]
MPRTCSERAYERSAQSGHLDAPKLGWLQSVQRWAARRSQYRCRLRAFLVLLSRRSRSTVAQTPQRDSSAKAVCPQITQSLAARRRRYRSRSVTRRASRQDAQTVLPSLAGSRPQQVQRPAASRLRRRRALAIRPALRLNSGSLPP